MSADRPPFMKPGVCVACAAEGIVTVPSAGYGKVKPARWGIELCDSHLREAKAIGWETWDDASLTTKEAQ